MGVKSPVGQKRTTKMESVMKPIYQPGGWNFNVANVFATEGDIRLRNRMQYVVVNFIKHFESHYFPKYIQAYKNYNQNNDDRAKELGDLDQSWRSNIKTPFVKMRVDALFSNLYTNALDLSTKARVESAIPFQKVYQSYIERCFSNSANKKALVDGIKEAIIIGNGFFRVGFKVIKQMVEYMKSGKDQKEVFEVDDVAAKLDFVSCFDIFYEEDGLEFHKKRRVIYRRWLPINEAESVYQDFVKLDAKQRQKILTQPYKFSAKNYVRYKLLSYYNETETANDPQYEGVNYELMRYDNSYVEVVEYREPNNFVVCFNGYVVCDTINPYPFDAHPFLQIAFQTTPGYTTGVGLGVSHNGLQVAFDLLFNAYLDSVKLSVAPMFKADKGFFVDGEENALQYIPYKILTSRGDNKELKVLDISKPDATNATQIMMQLNNIADLDAGTNRYTLGGGGIERSATGATYQQAITRDKLNPLIESINNDLLTKAAEYFSYLGLKYMPYQFKVRITGTDDVDRFETITHESLKSRFDIFFNVETFKNTTKELEKSQNIQALQLLSQNAIDPVSKRYLLDQEKIIRKSIDIFDFPADSMLGKDAYYERQGEEELAQMRARKKVQDIATAEGIAPPPFDPNNPQGGGGGFQPGGFPPGGNKFGGGGQAPFIKGIPISPSDPEEFERGEEKKNTVKVDMSDILARAAGKT